jgi:hypothetical protein
MTSLAGDQGDPIDDAGQGMRVGKYQDQMKCDRSRQIVLHTQPFESSRRLPVDIAGQSMRVWELSGSDDVRPEFEAAGRFSSRAATGKPALMPLRQS